MTADQKLQALFAESAPPARDPVFEAAVAERIARRRALASVAALAPWAGVGGVALWAAHPALETIAAGLVPVGAGLSAAAGAAVAAGVALWLAGRLAPEG